MFDSLPLLAWPLRQTLSILIFHRVLPHADPFRVGEPTAEEFDGFMAYLAKNYQVLPLAEAVSMLRRGRLPRRACCITFDDGYADNVNIALPILEKYRLPATVFVATGYLNGGRMFNDAVIDSIALSTSETLDLTDIGFGRFELATIENRRSAIETILEQLKYLPPGERGSRTNGLIEIANSGPLPNDIMMTDEQVKELSNRGVEIGGHTVGHPILTSIDDELARQEIAQGKQRLEAITGKPVLTFAYPNGRPHRDYTARHVAMVRELGFELAVSTANGAGRPDIDIFQLPRFTPWGKTNAKRSMQMLRNAWIKRVAIC